MIICVDCVHEKEDEHILMIGDKVMYENVANKTQSRKYSCPKCNREVVVVIYYNKDE